MRESSRLEKDREVEQEAKKWEDKLSMLQTKY
jgi:hypothetical protein